MTLPIVKELSDADATIAFGKLLAPHLHPGCVVYLHGELGAGKTTLVCGMLEGLGYHGRVKSPTYTLVEQYEINGQTVFHFDLYRLGDPEELEFLGIRDYLDDSALIFAEWPERGTGYLAPADIDLTLSYHQDARRIECVGLTEKGINSLAELVAETQSGL